MLFAFTTLDSVLLLQRPEVLGRVLHPLGKGEEGSVVEFLLGLLDGEVVLAVGQHHCGWSEGGQLTQWQLAPVYHPLASAPGDFNHISSFGEKVNLLCNPRQKLDCVGQHLPDKRRYNLELMTAFVVKLGIEIEIAYGMVVGDEEGLEIRRGGAFRIQLLHVAYRQEANSPCQRQKIQEQAFPQA